MSGAGPGGAVPETSLRHPGWRVAAGCFVMALCAWGWGFYGHSVYVAELTRIMGWSTGFVAGATTAYSLAGAALIPFVGELVARLGPRRFVLLGAALLALSVWMLAGVETKAGGSSLAELPKKWPPLRGRIQGSTFHFPILSEISCRLKLLLIA